MGVALLTGWGLGIFATLISAAIGLLTASSVWGRVINSNGLIF